MLSRIELVNSIVALLSIDFHSLGNYTVQHFNNSIKGNVRINSSDLSSIDGNARFISVQLKIY